MKKWSCYQNKPIDNPGFFNSQIVEKNISGSISTNGIFNESQNEAFSQHEEIVLSGKAPAVKVLYNLDGQEILGSLEKGRNKPLLYDNDELVLAQASALSNVKRDLDNVFYLDLQTDLTINTEC